MSEKEKKPVKKPPCKSVSERVVDVMKSTTKKSFNVDQLKDIIDKAQQEHDDEKKQGNCEE